MGLLWSWKPWALLAGLGVMCGAVVAVYRLVAGFPCPHCRTRFAQYDWLLHHLEHDCGRHIKRRHHELSAHDDYPILSRHGGVGHVERECYRALDEIDELRARVAELSDFCGCCGDEIDRVQHWCDRCEAHVTWDGPPLSKNTYFAQHGEPCPFQVPALAEESGERPEKSEPTVAIDANGYWWRVIDENYWSMPPTNPDNSPTPQPVTFYRLVEIENVSAERRRRFADWPERIAIAKREREAARRNR